MGLRGGVVREARTEGGGDVTGYVSTLLFALQNVAYSSKVIPFSRPPWADRRTLVCLSVWELEYFRSLWITVGFSQTAPEISGFQRLGDLTFRSRN